MTRANLFQPQGEASEPGADDEGEDAEGRFKKSEVAVAGEGKPCDQTNQEQVGDD